MDRSKRISRQAEQILYLVSIGRLQLEDVNRLPTYGISQEVIDTFWTLCPHNSIGLDEDMF